MYFLVTLCKPEFGFGVGGGWVWAWVRVRVWVWVRAGVGAGWVVVDKLKDEPAKSKGQKCKLLNEKLCLPTFLSQNGSEEVTVNVLNEMAAKAAFYMGHPP